MANSFVWPEYTFKIVFVYFVVDYLTGCYSAILILRYSALAYMNKVVFNVKHFGPFNENTKAWLFCLSCPPTVVYWQLVHIVKVKQMLKPLKYGLRAQQLTYNDFIENAVKRSEGLPSATLTLSIHFSKLTVIKRP